MIRWIEAQSVGEIKFYYQEHPQTCGPACLRMLLSPYQEFEEQTLASYIDTTRFGAPIQSLAHVAELLGFELN